MMLQLSPLSSLMSCSVDQDAPGAATDAQIHIINIPDSASLRYAAPCSDTDADMISGGKLMDGDTARDV